MGHEPSGATPAPWDAGRLRVSDTERHAVAEVLREAAGEGRLDLTELDERLEATYAAKTYADLVPLTADLPHKGAALAPRPATPAPVPAGGPGPVASYDSSFALMSETRRAGVWQVGGAHWALAVMGNIVIDLRRARFSSAHTTITANALMGSVQVLVNPHTVVVVDGIGVMGSFTEARSKVAEQSTPESPVVRIRGIALMGSVEVKRKG